MVDKAVAGAGGTAPGHLGVALLRLFGNELCGFADDFNKLREPESEEFVGFEVVAATAL